MREDEAFTVQVQSRDKQWTSSTYSAWSYYSYNDKHKTYERIIYDTPKFRRYGNCRHESWTIEPRMDLRIEKHPIDCVRAHDMTREGNRSAMELYSTAGNIAYWLPGLPYLGDIIDFYSAKGFETMQPTMRSGVSLTNFLLELGDIKSVGRVWDRSKHWIRNIASGHLNWSFGVKPLIKDLTDLYDGLVTWQTRLAKFQSQQGLTLVRHYKEELACPEPRSDACKVVWKTKPTYRATCKYSYTLPELSAEQQRLRGLLDTIGLHLNAAVVWEAIPYSFVVDWFVDVGGFLEQFSHDWLAAKVTILDFCSTFKWDAEVEAGTYLVDSCGNIADTRYHGTMRQRYFHRMRHIPGNFYGLQGSDRYGASQLALSSSLLITRNGKRGRF